MSNAEIVERETILKEFRGEAMNTMLMERIKARFHQVGHDVLDVRFDGGTDRILVEFQDRTYVLGG